MPRSEPLTGRATYARQLLNLLPGGVLVAFGRAASATAARAACK